MKSPILSTPERFNATAELVQTYRDVVRDGWALLSRVKASDNLGSQAIEHGQYPEPAEEAVNAQKAQAAELLEVTKQDIAQYDQQLKAEVDELVARSQQAVRVGI